MTSCRRSGAALVMALLMIVVLECIVLGTLQISLQEHRLAANRSSVLQLRLDAESGARRSLGLWTAPIDSMPVGGMHRIMLPALLTPGARVSVERIDSRTFMFESVAAEPAPRVGRSTTRLLVRPPVLPPDIDPAAAAASAAGALHVQATGVITAAPPAGCGRSAPPFGVLTPSFAATVSPGAALDAPVGILGPDALVHSFDRVRDLWPGHVPLDSILSLDGAGSLMVAGNLTVAPGTAFSGLVIVGGSATIAAGAVLRGAIHARGALTVAGTIAWDGCAVAHAMEQAHLNRPTPAGPRPWLPAF